MRMRQAAAAFGSWTDLVERRRFARQFLERLVGRWSNMETAGGFSRWRAYLQILDQEEASRELGAQLQRAREQRIRNIILKIKNRASAVAFDGWAGAVRERKEHRILVSRCLSKFEFS